MADSRLAHLSKRGHLAVSHHVSVSYLAFSLLTLSQSSYLYLGFLLVLSCFAIGCSTPY